MDHRPEIADFSSFYARSYPIAFRTALGICGDGATAADVTQDAFEAAYRRRDSFRGESPVEAWLLRIVVNRAISALRGRRAIRSIEPFDPGRHDRAAGGPDRADAVALQEALRTLEPRQRAAVVLRYYHDLDYAAIASILATSPGNVGVLLSRALDRLRPELEDRAPLFATTEPHHGH